MDLQLELLPVLLTYNYLSACGDIKAGIEKKCLKLALSMALLKSDYEHIMELFILKFVSSVSTLQEKNIVSFPLITTTYKK